MKEQLNKLAEEMIQEIKELKDLTKETLPVVAKEYVTFNVVVYKYACIAWSIMMVAGLIASIKGGSLEGWTRQSPDYATFLWAFGLMGLFAGGVGSTITFISYLGFKLQPRTKAIEGVVNAFKGSR